MYAHYYLIGFEILIYNSAHDSRSLNYIIIIAGWLTSFFLGRRLGSVGCPIGQKISSCSVRQEPIRTNAGTQMGQVSINDL